MNANAEPGDLSGTAAIVTGSSRNIGRAIALELAKAGAMVVINAKSSADAARAVAGEITSTGGRAIVHLADVTDADQVQRLVDAAVKEFGRLDILVNNVSVRKHGLITELSIEDWHAVQASILDAAFFCIKSSVGHLAKHGRGSIVNITGVSGYLGVTEVSPVAAAKAGLAGMTRSLAIELAADRITVNCVSPGYINTERASGHIPAHFAARPVPLGRPGEPAEIGATVSFLCGPGGRFISGQTIHVNGAWHVAGG